MRAPLAALCALAVAIAASLGPAVEPQNAIALDDDGRTGNVIVRFTPDAALPDVAGALEAADATAIKTTTLDDVALVQPEPGQSVDEAIDALEADPDVLYAEPDYRVSADLLPNDTYYGSQWHYPKIGLPAAWDATTGSATLIVAVVDTGVELTDPELDSKITSGANAGYDFANGDADPTDDNGHGTHVAGTIAAESNNSTGVAGICWACKIMPVKALDSTGSGSTLDVAAGIDWARTHGAKVINLSLGSLYHSVTLQTAVDNAFNAGIVVVGAAGNNAGDADTSDDAVMYPAAYPNAIGVGATDSSDTIAYFSNYGPELDVVAPGVSIVSTVLGSGYQSWSGTSMATPHVSGVVGLMMSAGITDPATIRARLTATATDLGPAGFDNNYGYGRINAHLAIDTTNPTVQLTTPPNGAFVNGSVNLAANASDGNGIANVRFWADDALLATDTSSPYATAWDTSTWTNGSHTVRAEATDNAGNTASHTASVTVNNGDSTPPTVGITSPSNGATVSGSAVSFAANASDASGIHKVRFWVDNVYLSYDATAPYEKTWDTTLFSNGAHTLKVEALDIYDNSAIQTITVTVSNADGTPPSASITSPGNGATVSGNAVAFTASASDASGIHKVRFWVDNVYLSYDATAPYQKTWDTTSYSNGAHTLKIEALDRYDNSTIQTITVTVSNSESTPPSASITSPANGATVSGSAVSFTATASDASGIQKVRFWVDNVYLSYDATAPYQKTWDTTTFANGTHTLKIEALDTFNNSTIQTITVTVSNADSTPPTVTITGPADGATVSGSAVSFTATASDASGIHKVRFWVDNVYLSWDATSPYEKVWDSTAFSNGTHTLKVEALDNNNNSTIQTITVTVSN
jgi:subtilisin family serine protease